MDRPETFVERPLEVEAILFTGDNFEAVSRFCGFAKPTRYGGAEINNFNRIGIYTNNPDPDVVAAVWNKTAAKWIGVKPNQWIVRGIYGELLHPYDEDIFNKTYRKKA